MKKWSRRIRGAFGTGLTWAAGWFGVGAIVLFFVGLAMGVPGGLGLIVGASLFYAGAGFLGGAAFSVILGIIEGRRRFDQMSLPRFTVWGAMGGGLLSILWGTLMVTVGAQPLAFATAFVVLVTLLGAGSAAGSLALARRADDSELLEAGEDVAEIGMTQEEKHALLGG